MARKLMALSLAALAAAWLALPALAQAKPVAIDFWYNAAASEAGLSFEQ